MRNRVRGVGRLLKEKVPTADRATNRCGRKLSVIMKLVKRKSERELMSSVGKEKRKRNVLASGSAPWKSCIALRDRSLKNSLHHFFTKDGYKVHRCGGSGDEGIDLILKIGDFKDVVQCKRWRNDIGSPIVREFYGSMMHANARHGYVITTASFSQSAASFARGKPISLISGIDILRWIEGNFPSDHSSRGGADSAHQPEPKAFDPYEVLGISRDARPEEIKAAYRREMANYHPDKVAHLGPELQKLANRKAQEINRAYEYLIGVASAR